MSNKETTQRETKVQEMIEAEFAYGQFVKIGHAHVRLDRISAIDDGPVEDWTTMYVGGDSVLVKLPISEVIAIINDELKKQSEMQYANIMAGTIKDMAQDAIAERRAEWRKYARDKAMLAAADYMQMVAQIEAGEWDDEDVADAKDENDDGEDDDNESGDTVDRTPESWPRSSEGDAPQGQAGNTTCGDKGN